MSNHTLKEYIIDVETRASHGGGPTDEPKDPKSTLRVTGGGMSVAAVALTVYLVVQGGSLQPSLLGTLAFVNASMYFLVAMIMAMIVFLSASSPHRVVSFKGKLKEIDTPSDHEH